MPRFAGRPVIVEAHVFNGSTAAMPDLFRLAVRRHLPDGTIDVVTGDGLRNCRSGDRIVRGPSGQFMIWHEADFETFFEDLPQAEAPRARKKEPANV